jgi:hypothetical protein
LRGNVENATQSRTRLNANGLRAIGHHSHSNALFSRVDPASIVFVEIAGLPAKEIQGGIGGPSGDGTDKGPATPPCQRHSKKKKPRLSEFLDMG